MSFSPIRRLLLTGSLWLGSCLLSVSHAGATALPISEEYVMRAWDAEDGLPQNTVTGLAQTPDGYLWIATQGGLTRFDGVRFTNFFANNTSGLESSYARAVATDRTGALWIGLERGGVARMKGGRFETILAVGPSSVQTHWASSFAEDAEGAIWIGMAPDQCVYRWRDGQLTKLTADDGVGAGEDTFVHADLAGRIWFANKKTCGVFDGTRFQPIDPDGGERVHLAPAREGGMWATRGDKLYHYAADGGRREVADLAWLGGAIEVNVLRESVEGDLWIGTRGAGLLRFRDGYFSRAPSSHQAVFMIFEGRDGILWTGTNGGLNRILQQQFFLRAGRHGFDKEGVQSLCEDTDGRLWVTVRDSEVVRSVDPAKQMFAPAEGIAGNIASTIAADPTGGVWLNPGNGRLWKWREGVLRLVGDSRRMAMVLCDHEGNVWVATERDGLIKIRDEVETPEPTTGGLVMVRALVEDAAGCVWAGTESGLVFRRQNGSFVPVPLPDVRRGDSIRFIVPDGQAVWIGARDGGLMRWHGGQVQRLPHDAGLRDSDLRALLVEPDGAFWLASGGRLFRTTRQSVEGVLAGRQGALTGASYGRDDGLPKLSFAFGRRNGAVRTRDGGLWFATDRGPLEIRPEKTTPSALRVPVLIEELLVDGKPMPIPTGGRTTLPPKPGLVEIHFTAPRMNAPERLVFRYRLAGLEETWTTAEAERMASYARLPPGNYRFEVAVSDGEGSKTTTSRATLALTVRAAWWETLWFRVAIGFLGAALLAALVRKIVLRRVRRRILQLEQQHALEKERSRIARDMHDELGASLTRISLMSELAADEPEMRGPATQQLREIAQAARSVSGTLDQIVWAVNPRNDTLERLVGYLAEFASEYLAHTGVNLHLDLPAEIPTQSMLAETRHEMLLATKEALNNVVKYAQASEVRLRVTIEGGILRIVIADDGRGFDPETIATFSNGLINLRQRLAALDGTAEIASQPGAGATVILSLPLAPI